MILVDSNVVLDVLEAGSRWRAWSEAALAASAERSTFVNYVIAAEVGTRFRRLDKLESALATLSLPVVEMSLECAWLAGRAHLAWIRNGGRRGAMLADILIGAHAVAEGAAVLTRDPRRFRTYFPDIELITPESAAE